MNAGIDRDGGGFSAFEKAINGMNRLTCRLVVVLGILLTIVIAVEVFSRYILNSSMIFVEELSRLSLVWFSYLGASLALHEGGHVGIDFVKQWLKDSLAGKIVRFVNIVVMAVLLVAMLYASLIMMPMLREQEAITLKISMVVPFLSITVGSLFMLARISYSLACLLAGREERLLSVTELMAPWARNSDGDAIGKEP